MTCKDCLHCVPYGYKNQKKRYLCNAIEYQHFIKHLKANRKDCKNFKEK